MNSSIYIILIVYAQKIAKNWNLQVYPLIQEGRGDQGVLGDPVNTEKCIIMIMCFRE